MKEVTIILISFNKCSQPEHTACKDQIYPKTLPFMNGINYCNQASHPGFDVLADGATLVSHVLSDVR